MLQTDHTESRAQLLLLDRMLCMLCTSKPHLDHGEEALVGGGVSGDGEASRGVPGDDAVHGAPGRSVRLVFVGHGQVSHDHVHPVLVNLSEELKEQRLDDSTLHKAVVNITNKQCFATANSSLSRRAERSISENKEHISTNTAPSCPACSALLRRINILDVSLAFHSSTICLLPIKAQRALVSFRRRCLARLLMQS